MRSIRGSTLENPAYISPFMASIKRLRIIESPFFRQTTLNRLNNRHATSCTDRDCPRLIRNECVLRPFRPPVQPIR
jgi:hypothetical protein